METPFLYARTRRHNARLRCLAVTELVRGCTRRVLLSSSAAVREQRQSKGRKGEKSELTLAARGINYTDGVPVVSAKLGTGNVRGG